MLAEKVLVASHLTICDNMHAAWAIVEIRDLILELLDRRDLGRFSRTSKAFFHIATDALWDALDSFMPLVLCLPSDFGRRPLHLAEIQRLDFYAAKVRKLRLEEVLHLPPGFRGTKKTRPTDYGKGWAELWEEIAALRPPSQFLPNLRRIRVNNVAEDLLAPLVGITGSNLTGLYLKAPHRKQADSVVGRFLVQLKDTPKLEYLFVRDGEPDITPLKLITAPSLIHLRLEPRVQHGGMAECSFEKHPLRLEILQKPKLEYLTLSLTRDWSTPEIEAMGKYLPGLKTLWLNLNTFRPGACGQSCRNTNDNSWTCRGLHHLEHLRNDTSCQRRSPVAFFEGLDNPELKLLNIKFSIYTTAPMLLEVVSAAMNSCRLQNLKELALTGGGWFPHCHECARRPAPVIAPAALRQAVGMLLPLPQLKVLRLSVAPNFLDVLDHQLYKTLAEGLPALETIWLGHHEFNASSMFDAGTQYEKLPLHHIAAFCRLLPHVRQVSVGCVDGLALEEKPSPEWVCPNVKIFKVGEWAGREMGGLVSRDKLLLGLQTYFPLSDLANQEFDPRLPIFTN
jgi:hypothetical protein